VLLESPQDIFDFVRTYTTYIYSLDSLGREQGRKNEKKWDGVATLLFTIIRERREN